MTGGQNGAKSGNRVGLWTGVGVLALNAKSFVPLAIKGGGIVKFAWLFTSLGSFLVSLLGWALFYGWRFAFLLVLMLLVHEMGHWLWMKAYKLNPGAPIFVPLLGAFVAMRTLPASEATKAWVAFAGPFVGGMSALALYFIGVSTQNGLLISASEIGFLINLLQLLPAKPFDGGFIVGSISRWLLIPGIILAFALGVLLHSMLFILISLVFVFSVVGTRNAVAQATAYKGEAKTLGELEKEIQLSRAGTDSVGTEIGGAAPAAVHGTMARATGKQRWAIGLSYLVLLMVLGVFQLKAVVKAGQNKECIQGDAEMQSQVLRLRHNDITALENRGFDYIKLNKFDLAMPDLEAAVKLKPEDSADFRELAFAQLMTGKRTADVVSTLMRARDIAKNESIDCSAAGYDLAILGAAKEARIAGKRCLDVDKNSLESVILRRDGQIDESKKFFDRSLSSDESLINDKDFYRRAMYSISDKRFDDAKHDIEKIFSEWGAYPASTTIGSVGKAWLLLGRNDHTKAITQASEALKSLNDSYFQVDRLVFIESCHAVKKIAYLSMAAAEKNSANKMRFEHLAAEEEKNLSPDWMTKNIYVPFKCQKF